MNNEEETNVAPADDTTSESNDESMVNKIVVRQVYFDNIKIAVDSLNEFFSSKFTKKDFPMLEEDYTVDQSIVQIIQFLNSVDASWLQDSSHLENAINKLNDVGNELDGNGMEELLDRNDKITLDLFYAFIGFKVLIFIADHFDEFTELMNAIYSMELFTKPSQYRGVIELFSKPIDINEIETNYPDANEHLFSIDDYVNGLYDNLEQITMPESLNKEEQIKRMYDYQDLEGYEIVVTENPTEENSDEITGIENETVPVQEAAEINFFENKMPAHLKYNDKHDKFQTSKQFQSKVNKLLDELESCETTDDLKSLFSSNKFKPSDFSDTVIPFILAKVFNNPKKYSGEKDEELQKYIDSYDSILSKNNGAKRFQNYDIFSTFKTDKENTIQFLKDFFSLDLVNNKNASINNNTLLTIFNIFDSRIYLDTLFNMISEKTKDEKKLDEDSWVKKQRATINQNSRKKNVYQKEEKADEKVPTTEEIKEYCDDMIRKFKNLSISDMMYCEAWHQVLHDEIATVDDTMFLQGFSPIKVDQFIGESTSLIVNQYNELVQEQESGEIPTYMKNRIDLSDDDNTTPDVSIEEVPAESDEDLEEDQYSHTSPTLDRIADSIDAKMNTPGDFNSSLGSGYESNPNKANDGRIVYNITNHYSYNNSFNHDSNNDSSKKTITNDLSSGKTVTNTVKNVNSNNDSSTNKSISDNHSVTKTQSVPIHDPASNNNSSKDTDQEKPINLNIQFDNPNETTEMPNNNNSYDNSNDSLNDTNVSDESDSTDEIPEGTSPTEEDAVQEFSNGLSIQDVFFYLETAEPLSKDVEANDFNSKPPKSDLLMTAMDNDRESLSKLQEAKKGVQKVVNTGKAALKPVTRTKAWLMKVVGDLVKRDEDAVKQELTENPSYRSTLFKALEVATHLGLTAICFTISGYLGAFVAAIEVSRIADKPRLREEIASECATEIQIIDEKIRDCGNTPEGKKQKYKLMRQREKVVQMGVNAIGSKFKTMKTIA